MPLPFNPMSFVTPYTAVGTASIGAGSNFANVMNQGRQQKVSEGYLQNAQRQQAQSELRYGQKEVDQARERLDGALMSGNQDAVELAANNLRAVAQRYGFSLTETRSDAQLKSGVTTPVGKQEAEVGSAEKPFDVDAYDREQAAKASEVRQAQGKYTPSEEAEADKRIDAELAKTPNPFTGGVPGGSLPAMPPGKPQAAPLRTPGGSLPASPVAEPPGASEAPLRGYTLIGADGKPLYSVAPKDIEGRQRQRVGDVFDGLASKTQDQQELQWLAQAKAETEKLVGIMPLDEAVKTGLAHYVGQMNARDKLSMVQANHRGGGTGGGGLMGKGSDIAESLRYYSGPARTAAMKTVTEDQQYADMEAGLNSGDPALQRNAINVLYKIRAGTAVSAAEDARVGGIVSALDKLENKFRQWTGGPISPELLEAMKQIVATKRKINQDFVQRIFDQAADEYEAQNEGKTKDPDVLKRRSKTIRRGSKIIGAEPVTEDDF